MGAGESVVVYYTGVRREDGGLTELLGSSEKLGASNAVSIGSN